MKYAIVPVFCLLLCAWVQADDVAALKAELSSPGTRSRATTKLKSLSRRDTAEGRKATLILARHYREAGDTTSALPILARYNAFDRKLLTRENLVLFFEQARCQAASGDVARANRLLDFAAECTEGYLHALSIAGQGDALQDANELKSAVASYKGALSYGDAYYKPKKGESVDKELVAGHENWPPTRRLIAARLAALEKRPKKPAPPPEPIDPIYEAYIHARKLENNGKNTQAVAAYESLFRAYADHICGQAAGLYKEALALRMGDQKAVSRLENFVKTDPNGLYRGEALLLLAEAKLERDPEGATLAFRRCLDWCERAGTLPQHAISRNMPASVAKKSKPPAESRAISKDQQVYTVIFKPEVIANRDTTGFYLRDLRRECHYYLGLLAFHRKAYQDAAQYFKKASLLDPVMTSYEKTRGATIIRRLEAACRIKFMVAEPEQLARIPTRNQLPLLLADFYLLTDRYEKATNAYKQILNQRGAPPELRAASLIGMAHCAFRQGNAKQMTAYLQQVDRDYQRTVSHPIALLALGANGALPESEKDAALLKAYRTHANSTHGLRAYFSYGLKHQANDPGLCRKVMETILRQHGSSQYASLARDTLQTMPKPQ